MDQGDEIQQLRAELADCRADGRRYFPGDLKQRAVDYVQRRTAEGAKVSEIGAELGVKAYLVSYWRTRAQKDKGNALRRVRVVEPARREPSRFTVAGPCGVVVHDMAVDDLAALFRKLS